MKTSQAKAPLVLLPADVVGGDGRRCGVGEYKRLGISLSGPANAAFVPALLPEGWRFRPLQKRPRGFLYDDRNRKRGAAFGTSFREKDYEGFMELQTRFTFSFRVAQHLGDAREVLFFRFNDCAGHGSFRAGAFTVISNYEYKEGRTQKPVSPSFIRAHEDMYDRADGFIIQALNMARQFITAALPRHADPAAYWNDDMTAVTTALQGDVQGLMDRIRDQNQPFIASLAP